MFIRKWWLTYRRKPHITTKRLYFTILNDDLFPWQLAGVHPTGVMVLWCLAVYHMAVHVLVAKGADAAQQPTTQLWRAEFPLCLRLSVSKLFKLFIGILCSLENLGIESMTSAGALCIGSVEKPVKFPLCFWTDNISCVVLFQWKVYL